MGAYLGPIVFSQFQEPPHMALTARQVETAKPKDKDYKLSDERGLYLLVKPREHATGALSTG